MNLILFINYFLNHSFTNKNFFLQKNEICLFKLVGKLKIENKTNTN